MKTLEEKARAYDKALERARKLYNSEETSADVEIACENIFPELEESEDERIRKSLIEYFGEQCDMSDWNGVYGYQVLAWLEKQGEQNLASFCRTCKNDALLDLLNKMPSCITVDGIDYHFVMKKTSYYIAYYKGNKEEYSGNAIFGVTAFSPIELLTAMLKKLKKEGLLE